MFSGNWCEENSDSGDGDGCSLQSSLIQFDESLDDDTPSCSDESFPLTKNLDDALPSDLDSSGEKSEQDTYNLLQQKIVNYLLKVKEENRVPQRTVQNIARATSHLFQGALVHLQDDLRVCLNANNIALDDIPGAADCFDKVSHCLDGLEKGWIHIDGKLQCVVGSTLELLCFYKAYYSRHFCKNNHFGLK